MLSWTWPVYSLTYVISNIKNSNHYSNLINFIWTRLKRMWAVRASTWPQSHPLERDTLQRSSQDILHCQGKTHSWGKCLVLRRTEIVVNKLLQKERCLNISREYQPKSSCGCNWFNFVLGINLSFLCSKLIIRDVPKYNQNNNIMSYVVPIDMKTVFIKGRLPIFLLANHNFSFLWIQRWKPMFTILWKDGESIF